MKKIKLTAFVVTLAVAGIVLAEAPKAQLPLTVYADGGNGIPYTPSGYMGDTGGININLDCTENPKVGSKCAKVTYTKADKGWHGVAWQNPYNNWGDKKGGLDLSGAKRLTFWARGAQGGEKVKFCVGLIGEDKTYHDTAKADTGDVVLTSEWKKYTISLEGKDLSSIVVGFAWFSGGQSISFYLDDIKFELAP